MLLNGKEIHVITSAIIIFQDIPLSKTYRKKLTEEEDEILDNLYDKVSDFIEKEYKKIGADSLENIKPENLPDSDVIRKRISIILNIPFSKIERELIDEALDIYIAEAESCKDGKSMNVYHGGDMYGLDTGDFIKLSKRLKEE